MTPEEEILQLKVQLGQLGCVYAWKFKGVIVYIGQTDNLPHRIERYLSRARNGSTLPLHTLIRDNNEEDFEVVVLFTSNDETERLLKESLFIWIHKTLVWQGGCNSIRSPGTRIYREDKYGY